MLVCFKCIVVEARPGTMVRLLFCDLDDHGSDLRNSLFSCKDKASYIDCTLTAHWWQPALGLRYIIYI